MNKEMVNLPDKDKTLILHSAYYAVVLHDWRDNVFRSEMTDEVKKNLIGKFPAGDPLNNLMNLAERLLADFEESKSINYNVSIVKKFLYGI